MHLRIDPVGDAVERAQVERAAVERDEVRCRAADQRHSRKVAAEQRGERLLEARVRRTEIGGKQQDAHRRRLERHHGGEDAVHRLILGDPQCHLEPRAGLMRERLGSLQRLQVVRRDVDPQVGRAQLEEADAVVLLLALVGRDPEPDRRQHTNRVTDRHARLGRLRGSRRCPAGLDLDDLLEALAGRRVQREAERELRPVRLVGGVRPVALIQVLKR